MELPGSAVEESVLVHARPFSVTSKAKQQVEVENVRVVECIRNSEKNHAMTIATSTECKVLPNVV